ncbi:MAG: transcriptional repressor LexA [Deltaproteobacteria bacterium]|nr:transcriptional repressor LexA [Deltaproteobacteria bacterium]
MKNMTRRQAEILAYIEEYITKKKYPPTVREIANRFKLASAAGVHKHIKALVKKNFLFKEDFISRSISLAKKEDSPHQPDPMEMPLLGYVAAGKPIEAISEAHETILVPSNLASKKGQNYVLRVKGDSMIDEFIRDGDYVIMEPRETAENGEMVVALINGREATLKRFYRETDHIRLQPSNPEMQPILIHQGEVRIQGIVVGIWRVYPK